jgi:hypothetical protein
MTGIDVTLYERTKTGTDEFNHPIYTETAVTVSDIIVAPMTPTDVITISQLYGKHAQYQLYIPKGDAHAWEDNKVAFTIGDIAFEGRVFAYTDAYIESMVPLRWNKCAWVEHYE